jgi:hypothetical protein
VRQGPLDPRIDQALILMGDWCGSAIRHRLTETPGLLESSRVTDNDTIDHSG